jgi:MFS family permease
MPVLVTATALIVIDFFIVNVAIPSMQRRLHTSAGAIEWVVAGYGLSFAVLLVTAGRLGDRYGRRRVLSTGITLFVAASTACGLAPSPAVLIAGRLVQGAAAALISPSVLSLIGVLYTGQARVRAIAIYGTSLGVAAAAGQLIGGALIQADIAGTGWRAVFLINIPVGVVALALMRALVPESRATQAHRVDLAGTALLVTGLTALVLPLIEGRQLGWPAWSWASLAASPCLLAVFAAHQLRLARRNGAPLLDPRAINRPALRAGLVTQLAFWCGQAAFYLVLALYLQHGRGLSPLASGLVFSVLAVPYLATSLTVPRFIAAHGRNLVALGAVALAAGYAELFVAVTSTGAHGPIYWLLPGLVLSGVGQGLCITPLTSIVLAHAEPERAGAVSGLLSTMQQVGNTTGVAITGVIFFGALPGGYARSFEASLLELGGLFLAVALITRILPGRPRRAPTPAVPEAPARGGATIVSPSRLGS